MLSQFAIEPASSVICTQSIQKKDQSLIFADE